MYRHKSLGLLTAFVVAPRLAIKFKSITPGPLPGANALENFAAKLGHYGLYGFMTVMPATGIVMGLAGGNGLPFFYTTLKAPESMKSAETAKTAFWLHKVGGHL